MVEARQIARRVMAFEDTGEAMDFLAEETAKRLPGGALSSL
jgi:hypothetical protein